jgi:hypothetical protein
MVINLLAKTGVCCSPLKYHTQDTFYLQIPQLYRKQKCSQNTTHNNRSIGLVSTIHFKERYKEVCRLRVIKQGIRPVDCIEQNYIGHADISFWLKFNFSRKSVGLLPSISIPSQLYHAQHIF